jgi:hypothetical protein
MSIAFYWLIACVCFTMGNIVPEPFFEDFQDQAFEESQLFFADQQGKSPWTFCTYSYFFLCLFYRIRTTWYEGLICAPMLGLTSIDLPFLGNLRSNWVVIMGLEVLSHACPGLDLGSCYVTSYYLCHPCYCHGYVDPISVENRIWGDGNGICWRDVNGSRLCPVWCWKPVDSDQTQV